MQNIRIEKEDIVSNISSLLSDYDSFFLIDYKGLSVAEMMGLRNDLRLKNACAKVFKNTLFKIALKNSLKGLSERDYEDLEKNIFGSLLYIFVNKEALDISKLLVPLHDKKVIRIQGLFFEKRFFVPDQVKELSRIPSKEVLIAQLLSILNHSQQRFLNVLTSSLRNFVYALSAISKTKKN